MWREAGKGGEVGHSFSGKDVIKDYELRVEGIDFGSRASNAGGSEITYDTLRVFMKYTGDKKLHIGAPQYRIDYLHRGTWYTVYDWVDTSLMTGIRMPGGPGGIGSYSVDSRVFSHKGRFRLYENDVGYCFFEIPFEIS